MALLRLLYLSRIELPNRRSHSIQMMRTCHAIAEAGVEVDFFVRGQEPVSTQDALDYYGLKPLDNLAIHTLRPNECEHLAFVRAVLRITRRSGRGSAFYTRDPHLARRLVRLRPLLRRPVFLETHALSGFFEREYLPLWLGEVTAGRQPDPRTTGWFRLVDYCYRRTDGVIALVASTHEVLRTGYPSTPAIRAWHGTEPLPAPTYDPQARQGIYYIGSLNDYYQPQTLMEAMSLLPGQELFVVGGHDEADLARTRASAERVGVADRVHFLGYVPPPRAREFYGRARVAVALLAGQKLAEYLAHGLPIVAPDLPDVRDVVRDADTGLLFKLGDPRSLATALRRVLEDHGLACALASAAYREALKHTWPQRARRIVNFIETIL